MNPQREPRRLDDLEPVPIKERKIMLLSSPRASSKGLNVKQVIPDSFQEWPGLPRGVKFDPSDEELLWHLFAEVGKGVAKRHPFISEFIISLDEDHGFGNIHPQFLPGVKQDGSMSYFFHRTVEVYRSQMKRQKKHNYYVEFSWHKICKTKLVFVDGIHQGSKEVMALYMIPMNGGNPEKTHWLMHQYHIATNGAEEDLVVSKIFCQMMSKPGSHELCTNSVECFIAEDAGLGSPLPVTPEFQKERLHLESISAEALTQVVDHDSGFEAIAGNLGCLKFTSSQKNYLTLEKSNANFDQHLEGTIAADGLPQLESPCDAAAKLRISSACGKSEIIVKDLRESSVERRAFTVGCLPLELPTMQNGFLRNLSAHGNSTNVFSCYRVRDDNMCYTDDARISLENSCAEKAPEHGSHKNVVDQMFKPQDRFMASSSSEINASGMHSSAAHKSLENLDTDPKCSGKDYISQGGNPTTEHKIGHGNAIIHSVILALPALNNKGNSLEESQPNNLSEKNSTNWLNASAPSVLPIKIEPEYSEGTEINVVSEKISSGSEPNSDKNSTNWLSSSITSILPIKIEPQSLEDAEIAVASEKNSTNSLNISTLSAFVIKVKAEPSEKAEAKFVQEKNVGELPEVSHLIHPVMSSSPVHFCLPKSNIQEKLIPHFYISKEGRPQDRFMASSSSEINASGMHSSAAHKSLESLDTDPKFSGKDYISRGGNPTTEHRIGHGNDIIHSVILALPALNNKGNSLEESKPNNLSEKNSTNWLNVSAPSVLPIKIEPEYSEGTEINVISEKISSGSEPNSDKNSTNWLSSSTTSILPIKIEPQSLEDSEIAIASEKKSTNSLNISTLSAFVIKVKAEPSEEAEAKFVQEKNVGKLPEVSHLIIPVMSSSPVHFCLPKSNIQEKRIPHFYISKEGRPTYCNSSDQTSIPEEVHLPSAELSTMISSLDELISETTGLINQHPIKDVDLYDCPLLSNGNSQGVTYSECFDQLSYPQINFHAGEAQHDSFSSSSLKVKLESMESNLLTHWPIPPCNTKELDIMLSKHPADFPSDIIDHVPLKYRMGIPFSQGDANMNTRNISEETAPETSGCGSFGSINAKASLFSLRRRRKKTATNLLEKAMEEDAPGLLQILLDRGILVEEIKLYGDMEDYDPLEIYSSEDSFEELETVMAKLFSERSSLLRFSFGRAVKESRAVYCLACLISLIEQTRYLQFRRTPVEWGWCRDLQSFIFVFQTHNRIVLERPEYGYATYFFELVESLPVDWQIKRLVTAMKLTNCSRTVLLENKPLLVGVDLTEGDARVMKAYGWTPNTGFGTMLNFCDRVVHDRRNELHSSEWRSKIGKLLMSGYDGGRIVLTNIPMKAAEFMGSHSPEIKLEQSESLDAVLQ